VTALMSNQNWANLATIVGALTVLAGTVYVAWSSRKASDRGHDIQDRSEVVESYSQLVEDHRSERAEWRNELAELRTRVEKLEKRAEAAEQRYGLAITYIRRLLGWIAMHLPEMQPPPVPAGIAQDLDQ
jgi:hypothetical protein